MSEGYEVVNARTPSGVIVPLRRDFLQTLDLQFTEGICAVRHDNDGDRSVDWYKEHVFPNIADGSEGPFDDRKNRISDLVYQPGKGKSGRNLLLVEQGVTDYPTFDTELNNRTDEENRVLQVKGLNEHGEPWAYFSRIAGVGGIPFSTEGHFYVGFRGEGTDAPGLLDVVSGHRVYQEDLTADTFDSNLEAALLRKRGVPAGKIVDREFIGAFGHPARGDFDFTYLMWTGWSDEQYESWQAAQEAAFASNDGSKPLQDRLVRISSMDEAEWLAKEGKLPGSEVVHERHYTLQGALEQLRESDFIPQS
jgi:hypothetical protein